jgi:Trk K+ transport system NAD-binding subunit
MDALDRAGAQKARAAVVDTDGERAASAVLAVGSIAPDLRTIAVIDHLDHEKQLRHAGADRVLTPRNLLGRRLAERVRRVFDPTRSDTVPLGDTVSLLEL